jgi:hypothetical protein
MAGFSLIEVLVSLLLLMVLLFSVDAMEVTALRDNRSAYFFGVGVNQINNMTEFLQTLGNKSGLSEQVALWNQDNSIVLPQGFGSVRGNYPNYKLEIFWGDIDHSRCQTLKIGFSGCLQTELVVSP